MTWFTISLVVIAGIFAGIFSGRIFMTTATNRFSKDPTARMPYNRNFATIIGGLAGGAMAFKWVVAYGGVVMGVFGGFLGGLILPLLVYVYFIGEHLIRTKFWIHVFKWGDRIGDIISSITIRKRQAKK